MKYDKHYFLSRGYDFKRDCIRFLPLALTIMRLGVKRVLDLGCAYGALIYVLRKLGVKAWGIDISLWAKNVSPVKEYIILRDLNKDNVPFHDEYFDCVTAINFLEHIKPYHCVKEIYRVLKRNGVFYASIPSYSQESKRDPCHITIWPFKIWLKLFISQGLKLSIKLNIKFWLYYVVSWLQVRFHINKHCRKDQEMRASWEDKNIFLRRIILWLRQSYRFVLTKR